jgi:RNA methyltransferase, TrmH family
MDNAVQMSPKNPLLQEIRRAAAQGRPSPDGWVVIEGPHLVNEALRSDWKLETVVTTAAGRERAAALLANVQTRIVEVAARAFAQLSATENPQEILALVRPPASSWNAAAGTLTVVLDGIQDPGNAGTIVRSAEAFGASGMIFLEGCVHIANGKFLRATAGSLFRLPFLAGIDRSEFLARISTGRVPHYALTAAGRIPVGQAEFRSPCALIVGSESAGIAPELLAASIGISIPTFQVESLNAAVACSIALFEAARQRAIGYPT